MKKLIVSIIFCLVFISLNLLVTKNTSAQGAYQCSWSPSFGFCGVDPTMERCDKGWLSDNNVCKALKTQSECENKVSYPCVKSNVTANPQPLPHGPGGANLESIESQIPGFKFRGATLGNVVTATLSYIFGFAGILLLLYLLYGGIHLMISAGDPKAMAAARGKITGALIGFVIIFVAFWIVQLVGRVFGLEPIVKIFG